MSRKSDWFPPPPPGKQAQRPVTVLPRTAEPITPDPEPEAPTEPLSLDVTVPMGDLIGYEEPRVFTPPLRQLTRDTTYGYAVADFADQVLGRPLLPWQRWVCIHALEKLPDGRLRFRTVLILVARQNGKSDLSRVIALYKLFVWRVLLVVGTAQDLDIARRMLDMTVDLIDDVPALYEEKIKYLKGNGKEHLALTGKRQYIVKATNDKAGRSLTVDHVTMDELREHRNWGAWGALSKTTNAVRNGQVWCFSNAGDEQSAVLNQLQANAQTGKSASLFLAEYSAEDGCALDDREGWKHANPALGYLITEEALQSSLDTDPPDVFRTECLCQRVASLDGAVNLAAWRDSTDGMGSGELVGRTVLCIDVAPDGEHVTLVGAAVTEDGRSRVAVLSAWRTVHEAAEQLSAFVDAVKPARLVWLPSGPAAAMGTEIRGMVKRVRKMELVELTGSDVTAACQEFAAQVAAHQVVHSGDALLESHIAGAKKWNTGDGWRFVRRGVGHVDAAYAAAGAVYVLRQLPPERLKQSLVI